MTSMSATARPVRMELVGDTMFFLRGKRKIPENSQINSECSQNFIKFTNLVKTIIFKMLAIVPKTQTTIGGKKLRIINQKKSN